MNLRERYEQWRPRAEVSTPERFIQILQQANDAYRMNSPNQFDVGVIIQLYGSVLKISYSIEKIMSFLRSEHVIVEKTTKS
jgi:hypothetical protein